MSSDIGNPIYTRLAFETGITDAQASFCRLACGTDETGTVMRRYAPFWRPELDSPPVGVLRKEPEQ